MLPAPIVVGFLPGPWHVIGGCMVGDFWTLSLVPADSLELVNREALVGVTAASVNTWRVWPSRCNSSAPRLVAESA